MSTPRPAVPIFDYTDYRRFLADSYRVRKQADRRFSHRAIAKAVRAGSAGWFADIVKGRTNLSGNHMVALARLLELKPAESEYFEILVRFDQAGSVDEKNLYFRRLAALKGVKSELVGADRFEYYSEWYHGVIRELLFFHDFRGDFAALGRKLHPAIGAAEARRSIQLLTSLGFIRKEASGGYRPVETTLQKDPAFKALHLANYLKAQAALGMDSLERFPKEERDISSMTLSLSESAFQRAKEEIRALRQRLLALTEEDGSPEKVYQCNFHMFPATR